MSYTPMSVAGYTQCSISLACCMASKVTHTTVDTHTVLTPYQWGRTVELVSTTQR